MSMASVVASDPNARSPRLSLSIDAPPSSSPFPSPSSSFLPPPMPGAHEFAIKPPPAGRSSRKPTANGTTPKSPLTPRPVTPSGDVSLPPSSATTPTTPSVTLPDPPAPVPSSPPARSVVIPTLDTSLAVISGTVPSTPTTHQSSSTSSPLTSTRPAPPSPALSRRASSSARSRSSLALSSTSSPLSRRSSTRKSTGGDKRFSLQMTAGPSLSPRVSPSHALSASTSASIPLSTPPPTTIPNTNPATTPSASTSHAHPRHPRPRPPIAICDFAFPPADPRYAGLGTDVPRPNRVRKLNPPARWVPSSPEHTAGAWVYDYDDDDDDAPEQEEDDDDAGGSGWGGLVGFRFGMGRFSWGGGSATKTGGTPEEGGSDGGKPGEGGFPSRVDLERNFLDEPDDDDDDDDGGEQYFDADADDGTPEQDDEEEPLYPGLYRALYAFEPEGTAEMRLEEDQIVRVVGRGGGVGWAVVVVPPGEDGVGEPGGGGDGTEDGKAGEGPLRHALVPESYLEAVRLDDGEEAGAEW